MDLSQLFDIQTQLDRTIMENHGLYDKDLVPAKVLALQVELGELANETRCFKFWSKKSASLKSVILEEYVDCLHFLLSIGLDCGFHVKRFETNPNNLDLIQEFQEVYKKSCDFLGCLNQEKYVKLFEEFLTLGEKLNFTWEEVEKAYFMKNEINHQRQAEGY
ncbi:dUTP diphosphatase [Natronincola ferrireducens]|uniref:Dimeric dUTPase, all-alpha-NTP-PPase (MazG) superfamily n=1 Tax=Natronincola ferrireducens TaxID=393762 RepID=A0A1G9F787_9FIRM|nr:dUTP diphosphatase [Natronincola ferrireducens]SDK84211.1 Dimeric dUTPase, all-alpha-NTP-PPase (MazG) superfamily [Natronincola ferrireducens]